MQTNKHIYFISDVHLGLHPVEESLKREKLLVKWLDSIKTHTEELVLLGDIFDFWHEYKHVVPRGYTRFLGKLAELSDLGITIHFFTGNHDIWIYDYLPNEIGLNLYTKPLIKEYAGKKFYLAHGDGLGKGDIGYKFLKGVFTNKILQFLFARLHPNFALFFGKTWSKNSRYAKGIVGKPYAGEEGELLLRFAKEQEKKEHFDYYIFGHRHIPYDLKINNNSRVINLGDWIDKFTFGKFDGKEFTLASYIPEKNKEIIRNYQINL